MITRKRIFMSMALNGYCLIKTFDISNCTGLVCSNYTYEWQTNTGDYICNICKSDINSIQRLINEHKEYLNFDIVSDTNQEIKIKIYVPESKQFEALLNLN